MYACTHYVCTICIYTRNTSFHPVYVYALHFSIQRFDKLVGNGQSSDTQISIFSSNIGNLSQNGRLASYRKSIKLLRLHFFFPCSSVCYVFSLLQYTNKYKSGLTCTLIITKPVQNNLLARSAKQQPIFQDSVFTARDILSG